MTEELVSHKLAVLAKEVGFDEPVSNHYVLKTGELLVLKWQEWVSMKLLIKAPTQSLLQKWFREMHNIHLEVVYKKNDAYCVHTVTIVNKGKTVEKSLEFLNLNNTRYSSFEKALEAGLLKVGQSVKTKYYGRG